MPVLDHQADALHLGRFERLVIRQPVAAEHIIEGREGDRQLLPVAGRRLEGCLVADAIKGRGGAQPELEVLAVAANSQHQPGEGRQIELPEIRPN